VSDAGVAPTGCSTRTTRRLLGGLAASARRRWPASAESPNGQTTSNRVWTPSGTWSFGTSDGFGLADARRAGFDVVPQRYAIADDQLWELFPLVTAHSTGDEYGDLDRIDAWIAGVPNTY
jgi:hypothetical protein